MSVKANPSTSRHCSGSKISDTMAQFWPTSPGTPPRPRVLDYPHGKEGRDIVTMASPAEWEAWLEAHHADSPGVWLKIAKKGSAEVTVSYQEALQVALCYGWIDGQKGRLDDDHWLQRFTPRRPGSKWSKINTENAAELIAAGRM